jgi:FKBP-type peptidyl-prolyl cis-trans isomerase FklB
MTNKMKLKQAAFLVMGLLPLGVIAQTNTLHPPAPPPAPPSNVKVVPSKPPSTEMPEKGKLSYAIGMYFGRNITNSIKRGDLDVDTDTILAAITDLVKGKPTRLSEKEVGAVFEQLKTAMDAKKRAEAVQNKVKGQDFLDHFAKAPGVTTLPGGLEYKVIKDSDGARAKEFDTVTMAYRGTLIDGTEFDRNDNFSTSFRGGIIEGWQKVLPLMKVGSKWQVVIPSEMAYGPRGRPPKIPADAVLIFDMELKSITPGSPTLPPLSAAPPRPASSSPSTPATPVVSGEIIKVPSADELKKGAKIEVIKSGQTNVVTPQ